MDQLASYQTIVKEIVKDYLTQFDDAASDRSVETLLITDDEHSQYLIIKSGWSDKERVQYILIFLRLVDGKIWVEEDWTDFDIVGHLLKAGIPKDDIVLAFHHPSMRPFSEFAVL